MKKIVLLFLILGNILNAQFDEFDSIEDWENYAEEHDRDGNGIISAWEINETDEDGWYTDSNGHEWGINDHGDYVEWWWDENGGHYIVHDICEYYGDCNQNCYTCECDAIYCNDPGNPEPDDPDCPSGYYDECDVCNGDGSSCDEPDPDPDPDPDPPSEDPKKETCEDGKEDLGCGCGEPAPVDGKCVNSEGVSDCPEGQISDGNGGCVPDPCLNKDLRHKKVSTNTQNLIDQRIHNVLNAPGTRIDTYEFDVQNMETDGVGDINLDIYSLKIDQLPNGYSPQQLFEEIRLNFDELVTGGDFFWEKTTFMPYDSRDEISWSSSSPLGSAMDFQTPFDTATVIATEYSYNEMYWTFTTVTSFDHWGHPVSGHRQFGIENNQDGSYSFTVRGADRLHTLFDLGANSTLPSPGEGKDFAFDLADRTWKNLMESIEKFIKDKPGSIVEHFDKSKNDYAIRHEYNKSDCPE